VRSRVNDRDVEERLTYLSPMYVSSLRTRVRVTCVLSPLSHLLYLLAVIFENLDQNTFEITFPKSTTVFNWIVDFARSPLFLREIAKSSSRNSLSHKEESHENRLLPADPRMPLRVECITWRIRIDPHLSRPDESPQRERQSIGGTLIQSGRRVSGQFVYAITIASTSPWRDKSLRPTSTSPSTRFYPEQNRRDRMINVGSLTSCPPKIRVVSWGRCALSVNALTNDNGNTRCHHS